MEICWNVFFLALFIASCPIMQAYACSEWLSPSFSLLMPFSMATRKHSITRLNYSNTAYQTCKIRTFICVPFMDVWKRMHLAGERRGLSAPSANKAASFIRKRKKLRFRCNSKVLAFRTEKKTLNISGKALPALVI